MARQTAAQRATSKALTQQSWGLVKHNRYLLAFPLIGFLVSLVPLAILGVAGGVLAATEEAETNTGLQIAMAIVAAIALFVVFLIANIFTAGLVSAVTSELRGIDSSFGEGLGTGLGHIGVLVKWSFVQTVVSLILSRLQSGGDGVSGVLRSLAAATAGLAWSVVTFLVMPILVNEDVKVFAAIKRSSELLKQTWGNQLGGRARIGLRLLLVVFLPALALLIGGIFVGAGGAWAAGIPMILLGAVLFAIALLLGQAVQGVFATVLYLYAANGEVPAGFTRDQLSEAIYAK
jgi:hypothetical protein